MIPLEDRQLIAQPVDEASRNRVRLKCVCCAQAGITMRSLQRCRRLGHGDRRWLTGRAVAAHALGEAERE